MLPTNPCLDMLKNASSRKYEEGIWTHLSGYMSAPFEAGEHKQNTEKVIDDRGNELLVVKQLA